jgi:hypothetical protein
LPHRWPPPPQTPITRRSELGGLDALGGEITGQPRLTRDRIKPDDFSRLIGAEARLL